MIRGNLNSVSTDLALRRFAERGAEGCPDMKVVASEIGSYQLESLGRWVDDFLPTVDGDPTRDLDPRPQIVGDHRTDSGGGELFASVEYQGDSSNGSVIRRTESYWNEDSQSPDNVSREAFRFSPGRCDMLRFTEEKGHLVARMESYTSRGEVLQARPDDLGWLLS